MSLTFHCYLEDLASIPLCYKERGTLIFPPSLLGKGARGLGFSWIFPHGVKSQENVEVVAILSYLKKPEQMRLKTSIKR
ncbi:S-layer region-like protein [Scytonema sp. HK-05]|nr:S-layer region-like protein [Scytonema sp. HK-05]